MLWEGCCATALHARRSASNVFDMICWDMICGDMVCGGMVCWNDISDQRAGVRRLRHRGAPIPRERANSAEPIALQLETHVQRTAVIQFPGAPRAAKRLHQNAAAALLQGELQVLLFPKTRRAGKCGSLYGKERALVAESEWSDLLEGAQQIFVDLSEIEHRIHIGDRLHILAREQLRRVPAQAV